MIVRSLFNAYSVIVSEELTSASFVARISSAAVSSLSSYIGDIVLDMLPAKPPTAASAINGAEALAPIYSGRKLT